MCCLQYIAMRDYQESVTTVYQSVTAGQTDAGQSDPYVPLCFTCHTKTCLNRPRGRLGKQIETLTYETFSVYSISYVPHSKFARLKANEFAFKRILSKTVGQDL